ncbi:Axin-1 Axis inhibition protein 1 [Triplophysa tibetana]|uniref:Axin-1 Axis inhibition protein 1 n=1 Tax=Triplophysa tibetana TaxID=1572043 RepID=A0A5A9PL25_9TELE|nr:Axin-1 Axis inhibition protein 1 [Triplophysa tibetana]
MSLAVCDCHGDVAGPRPPVPGEEDREVLEVKDDGQFFSKTSSQRAEDWTATPCRDLGFEPEGSASWDGPYEPWSKSLLTLLADQDGTMLFQQFLRGLGCSELLDFWFACSGFQKFPAGDTERRLKLAKAIYRCYLSERSCSAVSRQVTTGTSCGVMDAIRRSQLDSALFVQAHAEVQTVLEHNLFPLFLRSDVYIKHTQSDNQTPTKLTSSTDQQNTVLPRQPDSPSLGSETLPSYNKADQTSRTTRDREKVHKHLPHTPEEDAAVTDRSSLCHSQSTRDSSAPSLCYYDTEHDFNTCEGHTHSIDTRHSGFFFKSASSDFDCGAVYEEIREDETVLPTYNHKIIAKVERLKE